MSSSRVLLADGSSFLLLVGGEFLLLEEETATVPPSSISRSVTLLSGVKASTSDPSNNFSDVDRGWSR